MQRTDEEKETVDLFEILHFGEWITLVSGMECNNWRWNGATWERVRGRFYRRPIRNIDYRKIQGGTK